MILETIKSSEDIRKLSLPQLNTLCDELREKICSVVLTNGGHLASNLGVVELTVALSYVFDENDKIVWDVGHQSYAYKLLHGRNDDFSSLRQKDGVSGFPDTAESPLDVFNTGHASTSISAALGMACARDINKQNYNVIAVIGDGALTGGESYEALNNIQNTKMLVIFNDNDMSISKNVGSATRNLSRIRVGAYDRNKEKVKKFLSHFPYFGKHFHNFVHKILHAQKLRVLHNLYFDNFDLKYVGPVDGHDLKDLIFYLDSIKRNVLKPTVLHVRTTKGKGYLPAEENPEKFHKFVNGCADEIVSAKVVGETLTKLAETNDKIVCVTAAMKDGVGLGEFASKHPERFFDVGIAEEHAVTFCGGLACSGLKPYFVVYSTFLQRGYDQILHDVATQNLPVTFLVDKSGFIGSDGQSHQGLFDVSYLSSIPNLTVMCAQTQRQLTSLVEWSTTFNAPLAIRYDKTLCKEDLDFSPDGWTVAQKGGKIKVLCCGASVLSETLDACRGDKDVEIVSVTHVKPLDKRYLDALTKDDVAVTVEDNVFLGGFGSAVKCAIDVCPVYVLSAGDKFVRHATVFEQLASCGLDKDSIKKFIDDLK